MHSRKMISIIIPVYNSESTLERCLNSIVRQTYNDLEVIVIDDGSKDESLKIINSFNSRIDNLKIIKQDNSGVSVARNNGIQSAKGEYVLFLDSDDFLDDHCCEKAIENIVDSDLVIFGLNIYKNNIILRKPSLPNEKINLKNNTNEVLYLKLTAKVSEYKAFGIFPTVQVSYKNEAGKLVYEYLDSSLDYGKTNIIFNTSYITKNIAFDISKYKDKDITVYPLLCITKLSATNISGNAIQNTAAIDIKEFSYKLC